VDGWFFTLIARAEMMGAMCRGLLIHFQNWAIWGRVHVEI
jgi:hypothetical protein